MTTALTLNEQQKTYLQDELGIDKHQWAVLTDSLFPGAKPQSIIMVLEYCRARKLDPMKKPVHIVPIYSKEKGGMVDTVWPSIAEVRTTAMRTGQYAGMDAPVWGDEIVMEVGKRKLKFPEFCQITVYRMLNGQRVAFSAPPVYWLETYASSGRNDDTPNSMWAKRPRGQLAKCAEAAALRVAFPEEIGNDYTAEEMEGSGYRDVTPTSDEVKSKSENISSLIEHNHGHEESIEQDLDIESTDEEEKDT